MADFCNQCAMKHFSGPLDARNEVHFVIAADRHGNSDFSGISTEADTAKSFYAQVLCEGCGFCAVDHLGNCVSSDCDEKHGKVSS